MCHLQCRLDAKRAAGGNSVGYADRNFEACGFIGRNLLNDAHPQGHLRVPGIAGQQISHGICPTDLSWPAYWCNSWDPAVRVLGLAVPGVCTRDTDIGIEMEFMTHV